MKTLLSRRVSAVAELLAVLIVGNLLARYLLRAFFSGTFLSTAFDPAAGNALPAAVTEATTLAVRFAVLLVLGFALLWWRQGVTPRAAGLTLNRQAPAYLVGYGLLLFCVASLPWKLLVWLNQLAPIGQGLGGWDDVITAGWSTGVVLLVLVRAVILPPAFEEPLARGYFLARLRGEWSVAGSVAISSLIFTLSHGHFHQTDPLVIALALSALFAAVCWAYATVDTGSLVPALIAHALANTPEPAQPVAMGAIVIAMAVGAVGFGSRVARPVRRFLADWKAAPDRVAVGVAAIAISVIMLVGAGYRPILPVVAVLSVSVVVCDAFRARRRRKGGFTFR